MKKISCEEAQKWVMPFIEDELPDDDAAVFLDHIRRCPDCYDELETYFIVDYSLHFLDNDNDASYDLKRLLRERIRAKERELNRRRILKILFPVATIFLIVVVMLVLIYENYPDLFDRLRNLYQTIKDGIGGIV
ncbi:MAG: zf-HC2 domain-containing protein [Lachnospiraceae bacterium]|nr:zf-HC2 domain-containing protein [Lachnospiraceae bacterium]